MIFQARNLHLLRGCSFSSHDVPMWHFPCKPMRFSAAAAEIADKKTFFLAGQYTLHRYTVTIDSKKIYSTNYEMLLDVARCCQFISNQPLDPKELEYHTAAFPPIPVTKTHLTNPYISNNSKNKLSDQHRFCIFLHQQFLSNINYSKSRKKRTSWRTPQHFASGPRLIALLFVRFGAGDLRLLAGKGLGVVNMEAVHISLMF